MNILHCPKCGGDLIVNAKYTFTFTKKMIFTDEGWDELSDRVSDECSSKPVQTLGAAYCDSCGKEWTDEDTGVQYIIYREKFYNAGFGGITLRLNPDGSLYVVEPTTQDNVSS